MAAAPALGRIGEVSFFSQQVVHAFQQTGEIHVRRLRQQREKLVVLLGKVGIEEGAQGADGGRRADEVPRRGVEGPLLRLCVWQKVAATPGHQPVPDRLPYVTRAQQPLHLGGQRARQHRLVLFHRLHRSRL
jgi:hypothetical protein